VISQFFFFRSPRPEKKTAVSDFRGWMKNAYHEILDAILGVELDADLVP
jgi:hypothetical protein